MDFREALDRTIKVFGIKASELAQTAQVSEQALSRYRNKRQNMNDDTLYRLFECLPRDAQWHFMMLTMFIPKEGEASPSLSETAVVYNVFEQGAFSKFILHWLARNELSLELFKEQMHLLFDVSPQRTEEILNGATPTDDELGHLGAILRKPDGSVYTFSQLRDIRSGKLKPFNNNGSEDHSRR